MSVMSVRGGVPEVWIGSATTDVLKHSFEFRTNYVRIKTSATIKVYFDEASASEDRNYLTLASTDAPLEVPMELDAIWVKANTTATVEVLALQRRG